MNINLPFTKHIFIAIVFLFVASSHIRAQFTCGTDKARADLIEQHPEILESETQLEEFTRQYISSHQVNNAARTGPLVIPIVFHIIHQGGSENISDAQVIDQVRILNEDFNKRNADASQVVSVFLPIVAEVGIEFRLANIDPYGNCTNGIERINSSQTYVGNDFSKLNGWPREKYLNIWVVKSMRNGVAGYAYYPGSVDPLYAIPNKDGIIILSNYIGSIGTGSYSRARALTHEIGHYLNLKHTWGDTNEPGVACGDDDVNDTPITKGSTTCNLSLQVCTPGVIENVENFMDYSYCSKMYTEGQKLRMLAALNSPTADRSNLFSEENLMVTGTDDLSISPCAPVADFTVSRKVVCVNTPVTFYNASYNGSIDSYYWEFPTGTPSTSTSVNPQVQFANQRWQVARLTVSNAFGTSTRTDTFKIFATYDYTMYQAPYFEGFENSNSLTSGEWIPVNYDVNQTVFSQVNTAAHTGIGSAMLNNYYARADRDIDELISPSIDLTTLSTNNMTLSFYYSLASWNQSFRSLADSLVVYASANCGATWTAIYREGGSDLVNAGYQEGFFVPGSQQIFWKKVTTTINSSLRQSSVRFRFQVFSAVRGNNFYIDDINIGNALVSDVENVSAVQSFYMMPNPANNSTMLHFDLTETSEISVSMFDMQGKELKNIGQETLRIGQHQIPVNLDGLSKGIYLIRIQTGNEALQRKLVVQ